MKDVEYGVRLGDMFPARGVRLYEERNNSYFSSKERTLREAVESRFILLSLYNSLIVDLGIIAGVVVGLEKLLN